MNIQELEAATKELVELATGLPGGGWEASVVSKRV